MGFLHFKFVDLGLLVCKLGANILIERDYHLFSNKKPARLQLLRSIICYGPYGSVGLESCINCGSKWQYLILTFLWAVKVRQLQKIVSKRF